MIIKIIITWNLYKFYGKPFGLKLVKTNVFHLQMIIDLQFLLTFTSASSRPAGTVCLPIRCKTPSAGGQGRTSPDQALGMPGRCQTC